MSDLPQEAVQAAAEWLKCQYERTFSGGCPPLSDFEDDARDFLDAVAPVLAAQARAGERRKVAEEIAAEIERVVVSGDFERPKYERGGFFNDARWAAQIARQIGEARG